jgi:hypothetical protein
MASSQKSTKPSGSSNQFTFSLETPSLSSGTLDKYLKSVLGEDSASAIPDLLKPAGISEGGSIRQKEESPSEEKHQPAPSISSTGPSSGHVLGSTASMPPSVAASVVHTTPVSQDQMSMQQDSSPHGQQLATTGNDNQELIPVPRGQNYVDITEYLNMPQADAAKKLGIPPSTLSKRWKEAVRKRKWPYRMICKIDKEIMTLLHNVPQGPNAPPLPEEIETALGISLRKRQEELRPVVIRI